MDASKRKVPGVVDSILEERKRPLSGRGKHQAHVAPLSAEHRDEVVVRAVEVWPELRFGREPYSCEVAIADRLDGSRMLPSKSRPRAPPRSRLS